MSEKSGPGRKQAPGEAKKETRERLLDAAERLFGVYGLDGVSLRQIGSEAGSLNTVAVRYHFGSKVKLLEAIVLRRLPFQESRRALLLSEASLAGKLDDPKTLFSIILRPNAEEIDSKGRHSYAAFLLSLRRSASLWYPSPAVRAHSPVIEQILPRLQELLPDLPKALFYSRVWASSTLFLSALVQRDQQVAAGMTDLLPEEEFMTEILDMATAALLTPVSPAVAKAANELVSWPLYAASVDIVEPDPASA